MEKKVHKTFTQKKIHKYLPKPCLTENLTSSSALPKMAKLMEKNLTVLEKIVEIFVEMEEVDKEKEENPEKRKSEDNGFLSTK